MSERIERLLDDAWRDLSAGNLLGARSKARRVFNHQEYKTEAMHILGAVALEQGDARFALDVFRRAWALGYKTSDLLYDMGLAYEAAGNEDARREAFLGVLEMDEASGAPDFPDEDTLVETAEELLEELPEEMLAAMGNVPILVEDRPERALVEEGFDPRALGLFDGSPWSEQGLTGPSLSCIILYRANIAAVCSSRSEVTEQIRITLLHETAHFFGLDEDQVAAIGLA